MAKELSQHLETIISLRRRLDEEVQFIENVSNENKELLPTINALEDGRFVQFKTFDNRSEALLAKRTAMLCEPAFMPAVQEKSSELKSRAALAAFRFWRPSEKLCLTK
ncbi:hypothetical protein FRC03_000676 [Tulasnella sp. 419]|nr:hypothetical protein FRC03_000676 [Tulasnella sp. 419]